MPVFLHKNILTTEFRIYFKKRPRITENPEKKSVASLQRGLFPFSCADSFLIFNSNFFYFFLLSLELPQTLTKLCWLLQK